MVPEWVLAIVLTAILAAAGWFISWLLGRLNEAKKANQEASQKNFEELKSLVRGMVDKFDTIFGRLTTLESNCLTWEQFKKELGDELGPVKDKVDRHDKSLSVIVTTCAMRHKDR